MSKWTYNFDMFQERVDAVDRSNGKPCTAGFPAQPEQAIVHNRATMADILRMLRKDTCLHVSMAEASSSAEVAGVPWLRRFRIVVRIADAHL